MFSDPNFLITGRADRIERRTDGTLAILDYKTGSPPRQKDVEAGFAPQLPLEGAMAACGAFGPELAGEAAELAFWKLSGGKTPGAATVLKRGDPAETRALIETARAGLLALIERYDDPAQPYLSQPHPGHTPRYTDYAQLARVAEWDLSGDEEE